jgi:hypothetical protein
MLTAALPSICFAQAKTDSLVMSRVWNFRRNYTQSVEGVEQNVYMRSDYTTLRRNPTLFAIPTLYTIARGDRQYVGESYCKLKFNDVGNYTLTRQVVCGTIPHNRTVMATMHHYLSPNLYAVALYPDYLLSPFHRQNHVFYSYQVSLADSSTAVIIFRPHLRNTQLVSGRAMADVTTGRLTFVSFSANFDNLVLNVTATMSDNVQSLLPKRCITEGDFKFMGNHIKSAVTAVYECPVSLPDSIVDREDRQLMDVLRPIPLKENEAALYAAYDQSRQPDTTAVDNHTADTTKTARRRSIDDVVWDFIDDNMFSSLEANSRQASVRMSPLVNPQYLSYSQNKGVSYRLTIGARYAWNTHRYLTFNPQLGYNFKQSLFYYTAPLRMTYNPKRNGYAELTFANGNRISSGTLVEAIRQQIPNMAEAPEFKDQYVQAINNVVAFDWLEITAGLVYHRRSSTNQLLMREANLPEKYRTFAPLVTLRFTPWPAGPTLTANYEWGIKHVLKSNLSYARWEFDAVYKRKLRSLRQLNFRVGTGFYTMRNSDFFVDFTNFRDNNLPTGWDDDWAGQFQLLNAQWYNESDYYVRGHCSYDSPLLLLTWLPLVGKTIEMERLYVSALSIEHTRPYYELGYGFTNRFFSVGLFGTVLGYKFRDFGCKFTFELFRRW